MKQKIFSYAAMALIVLTTACKKGGDEATPDVYIPKQSGKFSGKVDNVTFDVLEVGCVAENNEDGSFLLVAVDKNENNILLTAPNKTGTFTGDSEVETSGIYQDKAGKMWMSSLDEGSITVTITKFNKSAKKISGTYSFTAPAFTSTEAAGTKVVTGSFEDVDYATSTD